VTVYVGSDGNVYPPSTVVQRLEGGEWQSGLYDTDDGRELVETGDGEVLLLVPRDELDRTAPAAERRSTDRPRRRPRDR